MAENGESSSGQLGRPLWVDDFETAATPASLLSSWGFLHLYSGYSSYKN